MDHRLQEFAQRCGVHDTALWPGEPPRVSRVHPGYHLLSEAWADLSDEVLRIVQALQDDAAPVQAFGADFVAHLLQVKRAELRRFEAAADREAFDRTEYFSRF